MAVDLMACGYSTPRAPAAAEEERLALQEAATAGLRSLELLVSSLSPRCAAADRPAPLGEIADQAVSRFRRVINILDRTGHARFRRGPVGSASSLAPAPFPPLPAPAPAVSLPAAAPPQKSLTLDFTKHAEGSVTSTSFFSSVTAGGDGSVSKGRSQLVSSGKPPLAAGAKRKPPPPPQPPCPTGAHHHDGGGGAASRCHCAAKKRKQRVKRTVRVPAAGARVADIPSDDYSWRKYGQKPIKGSPYPRGYYRCSSVKGCPARKHVERATDDPSMLVVTYEDEHRHSPPA